MDARKLKVLVYGGTGSQGLPVVLKLLERGHTPYVLTRDAKKAVPLAEKGAKIITGNTGNLESLRQASEGMDAIALMTPLFTDVLPAVSAKNAIQAAAESDVKMVVWNTGGKAFDEPIGNPLLDHQPETTQLLRHSGLPYIILQPTVYLENLLGPYTTPFVRNDNKLAYPHPEAMQVHWISSQDMGALVTAALEHPELAGSYFEVSNTERLNGTDLAGQFSLALGRDITYYAMPPAEFGAILNNIFGAGAGDAVARDYQMLLDKPEQQTKYLTQPEVALKKLGVKPMSVRDWVSQYAAAFTR